MLSIRNITKQYAAHKALDDVSLEIEKGSIFGLLGPNGAGKTSLIRIINQITAPDSGEVFLNGEKLNRNHIEKIGYLPEERGLYKKMEIGEQMLYLAQLKGLSRKVAENKIRHWFEKMEMEPWWKKKVEDLSKGMQQKVQFVATVMHEPELIILDEPFSGFDPVNAEIIKDEILELNRKGATVIFSTHRMETVEQLCDHIGLIDKSKKILEGTVKNIRNSYRNETYILEYSGTVDFSSNTIFEILRQTESEGLNTLTFRLLEGKTSNDALQMLLPHLQIHGLREVIPTMHEIFIQKVKSLS